MHNIVSTKGCLSPTRATSIILLIVFGIFGCFNLKYLAVRISQEKLQITRLTKDGTSTAAQSRGIQINSANIDASSDKLLSYPLGPPIAGDGNALKSYSRPIVISIVTGHFLGDYGYNSNTDPRPACMLSGVKLNCSLEGGIRKETADALWHHMPQTTVANERYFPNQLRVGMSMESAAYYPQIDDKDYTSQFDVLSTYKFTADVVNHYYDRNYDEDVHNFLTPPLVTTAKKKNQVAYINRNCGAQNGRNAIVAALQALYPIEAYGCLGSPERADKLKVFSESKFCIAMENSNMEWYVTEKIWRALEAGCLPIYMGASNFEKDFMPHPLAAIIYDPKKGSTPENLAEKLKELAADDVLYEKHMAWRGMPLTELSHGFQRLVEYGRRSNPECRLCMKVAERRYLKEKGPSKLQ